jgi:hypothetical protein
VAHFAKEFTVEEDGAQAGVISKKVDEILELQAVEVIYAMRSLKADEKWTGDPIKAALTPEALTACLSPRWALLQIIRRNLSHALGGRS